MGVAELVTIAERPGAETAIIFVHGFSGSASGTWGQFPSLIQKHATSLNDWAIYSLGYATKLAPDLRGIWSGDPDIPTLATYLHARCAQEPLRDIRRFAFVGHSMGGLVIQKALVDFEDLAHRTGHVILFGTPSGGLKKVAGLKGLLKRQSQDMAIGSRFITELRGTWRERYGDAAQPAPEPAGRPFGFWVAAGDRDEFVPARSSIEPFATADRVVVPGNHLQIVKPEDYGSMSVQAVVDAIVGDAAPGGPWNAARVSVELGDFHAAIELLEKNAADLDDDSLTELAIALDAVGRRDDAIEALESNLKKGTDPQGVLAGRQKRLWWSEGLRTPAENALKLYRDAFDRSRAPEGTQDAVDAAQAFYHGINVAFMQYLFEQDEDAAKQTAEEVLAYVDQSGKDDVWARATRGEAHLYRGDVPAALEAYRSAVETGPQPWQMDSMYSQAMKIVGEFEDQSARAQLDEIFR